MAERVLEKANKKLLLTLATGAQKGVDNSSPPRLSKGSDIKKKGYEQLQTKRREYENNKMLQRLLTARNTYSAKTWDREELHRQKILHNMCKFPPQRRTKQSNISGEGWGKGGVNRPSTAITRRENAWNSDTTDVYIRDSTELLHLKHELPSLDMERGVVRPKTAATTRRKKANDAKSESKIDTKKERVVYGQVLRNKPGYSNDPQDREFDAEYKELFAFASEEYLKVVKPSAKKTCTDFS